MKYRDRKKTIHLLFILRINVMCFEFLCAKDQLKVSEKHSNSSQILAVVLMTFLQKH